MDENTFEGKSSEQLAEIVSSMGKRDQLRRAIKESGLSAEQFAKTVLLRDGRTVRRWIRGETAIPSTIINRLNDLTPDPTRLHIYTEVKGDYFHITCQDCGDIIRFSDRTPDGGSFKITLTCDRCEKTESQVKLQFQTWAGIFPPRTPQ